MGKQCMVCGEEIYDFTYCMKCGESAPIDKGLKLPKKVCKHNLPKGEECENCPNCVTKKENK